MGGVAEVSAAARWSTRAGEGGSPLGFREGGEEEEEEATTAAAPDGCGRLRAFAPLFPFVVPKTKSHERLFSFHVPSRPAEAGSRCRSPRPLLLLSDGRL